ncbi:hypothetical protein P43SY_011688 [Pythium insidiosum]|uniref:Uncharacterized protein n=1 Tax=Pythium insidiosum TaxID=114742 RepID=A0AAD5LP86_PYTIN|nr:hypothetical protein P43SY_011688 [Pythium insidiosum]
MADTRERLSQHREAMKTHRIGVRKVLVAYRQKAKAERLQQARNAVMHRDSKGGSRKSTTSSGSAVDVTAALRRTRKVMTDEIERVGSVSKVLGVQLSSVMCNLLPNGSSLRALFA